MSSPLLSKMREDYKLGTLEESSVLESPFKQYEKWLGDEILWKLVSEPNAMVLSTCSKDGKPSGRVVLLKYFDENGFVFFTNYNSRKSRELTENQYAALTFYWTQRQVRIEGTAERLSKEDSEKYFAVRPRESQIGAWVSEVQSAEVTKQSLVEAQYKLEKQFKDQPVPMPEFWGGWRIVPTSFEFWQGKGGRIHDRLKFKLNPMVIPLFKDLHIDTSNNNNNNDSSNSDQSSPDPVPLNNSTNDILNEGNDNDNGRWIIKRLAP